MRKLLFTLVAVALVALAGAGAPADAQSTACPGPGSTYEVNTAPEALDIAAGYKNVACTLIIRTSVPVAVPTWKAEAAAITIEGKDVLDASKRVEIINAGTPGDVVLVAQNGDVFIKEATIKGKNNVTVDCNGPATCDVTILDSEVMAPLSILDPSDGNVRVHARDSVRIENSTYFGGNFLYIIADLGSIVWFCPTTGGGCVDPLVSGVAALLCPGGFPCLVNFPTAADLQKVCIRGPEVICGGGSKEIRVTALKDIDLQGSTILALDHVTFTSKQGKILLGPKLGNKTVLEGENFNFNSTTGIDLTEATIIATGNISMEVTPAGAFGCPIADAPFNGTKCIVAPKVKLEGTGVKLLAKELGGALGIIDLCDSRNDPPGTPDILEIGAGLPKINNETSSPYGATVLDTVAECGALAPPVIQ
jgi:hypothetical protein